MPDVFIEFHGDAGDAVAGAAEVEAALERIRNLALQVNAALGGIEIGGGATSRVAAQAAMINRSLQSISEQALRTRAALAGIDGGIGDRTVISAGRDVIVGGTGSTVVPAPAGGRDSGLSAGQIGMLSALGWGRGQGTGRFGGWGPFGWAFAGMTGGWPHARMGTPLALMGLDAMRLAGSTLGIAGSAVGGLAIGGGLYGLGILGTGAVGMGTDMAGIGQASGDIHKTTQAYDQLAQAIAVYGRNSTQAQQAQQQLNFTLAGFPAVARASVLQASMAGQSFKTMFDRFTGPAESTGAQIITQGIQTGQAFLPTLGRYAAENMKIIQSNLQPLFQWMQKGGTGNQAGGLGIFTQLEQLFQNRLPTAVHAGTQAFELFSHAVLDAANRTGNLLPRIDAFLTKLNTPSGLAAMNSEIGKMMGLFRAWIGLFGSLIRGVYDLFKPSVKLGEDFAKQLTSIINKFRDWINLGSTQSSLKTLFAAHRAQLDAIFAVLKSLLPIAEGFLTTLIKIEAVIARWTVGPIKAVADVFNMINRIPLASTLFGWAGAMALIYKGANMLFVRMTQGATASADSLAGVTTAVNATTAAVERLAVAQTSLATATAGADAALAGEAAAGSTASGATLLSTIPGGAAIGARFGAMRTGLMAAFSRFLGPGLIGLLGGSIASSLITPHLPSGAQGVVGNMLTYGGLGAGIGSVVPGVGTLIGGGIGAGVGGLISAFSSLHGSSSTAASQVLIFANAVRSATAEIHAGRQAIRQTHLTLAQDRVARDQQAQQIAQDRAAVAASRPGADRAAAIDQLRADLATYGETLRRINAEEAALAKHHEQVAAASRRAAENQRQLVAWTQKVAEAFRNERVPTWLSGTQAAARRVQDFVAEMDALATSAQKSNPQLAGVYQQLAKIAETSGKIPNSKTISVYLKFMGGGQISVSGKGTISVSDAIGSSGGLTIGTPVAGTWHGHHFIPSASNVNNVNTPPPPGLGGGAATPATPTLPAALQGAIDKAATTATATDDIKAMQHAIAWVQAKIAKLVAAHASLAKLDPYYAMLSGLQGQLTGVGSGAWSTLTSAFDSVYGQGNQPGAQLAAAQAKLAQDRLALQLGKAQSGVLGGTADSSMAEKIINDMAGVLASPGGKKQKYTQQEIDNWLAKWGIYYEQKGYTPKMMYEAFNKLLRENGLPTIDNPFSTGGLPLPPGVGASERAAATAPNFRIHHPGHHRVNQQHGISGGGGGARTLAGGGAVTNTHTRPVVVDVRFEGSLKPFEKFVTVIVDGEIKKQGTRANQRARSGRYSRGG